MMTLKQFPYHGWKSLISRHSVLTGINRQAGVALLTVLLVTALMTVFVLSMTWQRQLELRRTANLIESDQAMLLALGLEEWAGKLLQRDRNDGGNDNLGEIWAMGLPPTPVEQGQVSGDIRDLQGRINLNNLLDQNPNGQQRAEQQVARLLELCEGNPQSVSAIVDWLDENSEVSDIGGAEDRDYLIRQPPYRAGNRPMVSPTELLLVEGINGDIYDCMAPAITVLPGIPTDLNINTASPLALASLSPNLPLVEAEQLVTERPDNGYDDIADFQAALPPATALTNPAGLSLTSDYFLVEARTIFGHAEVRLYSVMQRTDSGIKVISRSIGTI